MKLYLVFSVFIVFSSPGLRLCAQSNTTDTASHLYIDVHHLGAGKVTYEDVAKAHAKDIAVEKKYGVQFIKFWVDEKGGNVYCLSSTTNAASIRKTHSEAHGLVPDEVYQVTEGMAAQLKGNNSFFLDVHQFGPGTVTAKDVAAAHQKDLAVEHTYGVNFINYWVNEKDGVVMCLSQAPDSSAVIKTHKDAHGLLPAYIVKVKEGQ